MPLAAGTRLGPYEIGAPIGAGGMGEVYRAHDGKLGRDVAIKVLPEDLACNEERVARFEREAKLLASLNHPNIAAIYGFEHHAIVLELVEGPTLAERIKEGPIPVEEALAIARQIADALEAGHEAGRNDRDHPSERVRDASALTERQAPSGRGEWRPLDLPSRERPREPAHHRRNDPRLCGLDTVRLRSGVLVGRSRRERLDPSPRTGAAKLARSPRSRGASTSTTGRRTAAPSRRTNTASASDRNSSCFTSTGKRRSPKRGSRATFATTNAVFSPDGRYVALVSGQTGQEEIYIYPFPGPGGQTPVSVGGGREPSSTASGEIFYRRPDDHMMMAVGVTTDPVLTVGPPRELFPGSSDPGGSPRARYAVTADGERFLMSADLLASGEGTGSRPRIAIVQNWVQELEERVPAR